MNKKSMTQEIYEQVSDGNQRVIQKERYSGFLVRLAAHIIDGFIVSVGVTVLIVPLSMIITFMTLFDPTTIAGVMGQIVIMMSSICLGWAYHIFMIQKYGATFGKQAVGIRVQSEDGTLLRSHAIIVRETVGKLVSGLMLCVGYFMIAFTEKKQGLHDIMGKTVVVYVDPEKGPNKLVVGVVYGIQALIVMAFMSIIAVVMIFFMFVFSSDHKGSHNDADQWQNDHYEKNFEDLRDVISENAQQS